jgi:hypothetical protein
MYEELLPLWKARCLVIRTGKDLGAMRRWTLRLTALRLHWEWVNGHDVNGYFEDCLVQSVMLFTHEAGLEP